RASQGSVLNGVYRSGANAFHVTAVEFLRNSALDANSFFSNQKGVPLSSFKRNQFGGDFSGPIRRNKDFFLVDYAGLRERSPQSTIPTVPTAVERIGDFSHNFASN